MRGPPPIIEEEHAFARRSVRADGLRLNVVDDGPRDARETLFFVHGNPTWSFLWRKLLAAGRDAGHRVIAPDHAGFGESGKPVDPAYYDLPRHVDNLERVTKEVDARGVTLVLHDWGGPIGMGLAVRHPDRVRRIVIANSVAFAPRRKRAFTPWHAFFASRPGYQLGVRLNLVEQSAMLLGVRRRLPLAVKRAYDWPMRVKGGRVAASRFVQMVPNGPDHPTAPVLREIEDAFHKLAHVPMLVLWADRDPVMPPRYADKWKRVFPHADVRHVSATVGHFWQEDDPQPFIREIMAAVGAPPLHGELG